MALKQLAGTPGDRIGDIRTNRGLTKKELSELTGIDASQLTRIENGDLKTISSEYLIKLSKALNVSTDYILGLTTVSVRKSYDISELGLSEGAIKALVLEKANVATLNRLLEHPGFPKMINLIRDYFDDSRLYGALAWNEVIDMATADLSDFKQEHPEYSDEIRQDINTLKSRKIRDHEAEIEKIKNMFMAILRDIKKDMDNGTTPTETVTKEILREIKAQLPADGQKPTEKEMAAAVAAVVSARLNLGTDGTERTEKLMKFLLQSMGQ